MNPQTQSWQVVRETWLTRKPSSKAWLWTAWSAILLLVGSVMYWQNFHHAADLMPASFNSVFKEGQWWRLWTTLFAHGDMGHLLSNSLLFSIFGYFLSGYFGAFVFPLAAFAFGGLTNALVLMSYPPDVRLIGVSGVVYWMGGVWLILYFLLDQQRTRLQRSLRSIGVGLSVFMPTTAFDPQVSYQAHFVGFVMGLAFGVLYYWFSRDRFRKALVYETIYEDSSSDPFTPDEALEEYKPLQ